MSTELVTVHGIRLDEYGEVVLRPETVHGIATMLRSGGKVLVGMTDEEGTHLDLLFVWAPPAVGELQRGLHRLDLFVTLFGYGGFGFSVPGESHSTYIAEKLGFERYEQSSTAFKLTELINELRRELSRPSDSGQGE